MRRLCIAALLVVLTACGPSAPAAAPLPPALAPRTPVPTLDPTTEANAQWKTLIGVATSNGIFDTPLGMAVDARGVLYVADASQNRLVAINSTNGQLLGTIGSAGNGPLLFQAPVGVAVDSQ